MDIGASRVVPPMPRGVVFKTEEKEQKPPQAFAARIYNNLPAVNWKGVGRTVGYGIGGSYGSQMTNAVVKAAVTTMMPGYGSFVQGAVTAGAQLFFTSLVATRLGKIGGAVGEVLVPAIVDAPDDKETEAKTKAPKDETPNASANQKTSAPKTSAPKEENKAPSSSEPDKSKQPVVKAGETKDNKKAQPKANKSKVSQIAGFCNRFATRVAKAVNKSLPSAKEVGHSAGRSVALTYGPGVCNQVINFTITNTNFVPNVVKTALVVGVQLTATPLLLPSLGAAAAVAGGILLATAAEAMMPTAQKK
jgi:hypothetical protein